MIDDATSFLAEAKEIGNPGRIVSRTRLVWKQRRFVLVSTVFLPWALYDDHMPPFETLVGGQTHLLTPPLDAVGEMGGRYWTVGLAEEGHRAWCRLVAGWLNHAGRHTVTWQEMTTW